MHAWICIGTSRAGSTSSTTSRASSVTGGGKDASSTGGMNGGNVKRASMSEDTRATSRSNNNHRLNPVTLAVHAENTEQQQQNQNQHDNLSSPTSSLPTTSSPTLHSSSSSMLSSSLSPSSTISTSASHRQLQVTIQRAIELKHLLRHYPATREEIIACATLPLEVSPVSSKGSSSQHTRVPYEPTLLRADLWPVFLGVTGIYLSIDLT